MAHNVVVLASGETELRALPHLVSHLQGTAVNVRIPPNNGDLVRYAERLIKAVWHEDRPDKIVLLVDVDGKQPEDVMNRLRDRLAAGLPEEISRIVLYAYARWHLEAWYFADPTSLQDYLDRDLGKINASKPDEIENPKLHLKHLLRPRVYTATVSENIAKELTPQTIEGCSPSFKGFVEAVRNGIDHGGDA